MSRQSSKPGTGVDACPGVAVAVAGVVVDGPEEAAADASLVGVQPRREIVAAKATIEPMAGGRIRRRTLPSGPDVIDGDRRGHPERQARPGGGIRERLPGARAADLARLRGRGRDDARVPD